jgi:hypothetical protein
LIDEPISYSENCAPIVNAFNIREKNDNDHHYWELDEVKPVRKEIKDFYKEKQKHTCSYCAQKINVDHGLTWGTDHIVPRATHPQFMFEPRNLCIACNDCNLSKSDTKVLINQNRKTYPMSSEHFLIVHPHFDIYEKHIQTLDKGFYRARSKKGSYTIIHCDLLRFGYKFVDWDESISQKPKILEMANKLLATKVGDEVSLSITENEGNDKMILTCKINGEVESIE